MRKRKHVIIMVAWTAALAVATVLLWGRLFPGEESAPDTQETPVKLVGEWRRGDGGYVLDIRRVHDDGTLDAVYLNPNPIHVSNANTFTQEGHVVVTVTLQDKGYPGSNYTLTYNPDTDRLEGIYDHRVLNQQFNVAFARVSTARHKQE
jgi:hypothetical protein